MYDSLINVNGNQVPTLDILLMLTIISLLPSLLIMVSSFARTVIILSFRDRDLPDTVYHGSGDQGDQYGSVHAV